MVKDGFASHPSLSPNWAEYKQGGVQMRKIGLEILAIIIACAISYAIIGLFCEPDDMVLLALILYSDIRHSKIGHNK